MVYDVSKTKTSKKKDRNTITGRLIGIQCDSDECDVYDKENGKYSWLRLSIVTGKKTPEGKDEFFNCTCFDVDLSEMSQLKRADELLIAKKHPMVQIQYYTTESEAKDKNGQPIFEEKEEERNGKTYIVKVPKKYINYRSSESDIIEGFKVLKEDTGEYKPKEPEMEVKEETVK